MLTPRFPSASPIDRGFRQLAHGRVHYRAGGNGPPLLALHESPRSSLSLLPVIDALAYCFHVIAPDTPGYGLSAPLPGDAPTLDAFVAEIGALLDSLGLGRVAIYGAHTGAALALAFAHRHPHRVAGMVLDGVSAFDAAEVEAFGACYLEPYRPTWDGAHVMRTWSRVKDLFTWFPWYEQTPERRLARDPSDLGVLDRSALGFLQAGVHYAKAYIHAAAYQPDAALHDLTCPITLMARPDDLIADHLTRITPGASTHIRWLGPSVEDWREALREEVGAIAEPDSAFRLPNQAPRGDRFTPLGRGWLHTMTAGPEDGPLRVVLPGLPGDIETLVAHQASRHPDARLVALSPPGCGWSDPLADPEGGLGEVVAALGMALDGLGLGWPSSLAGEGAGAVIARLWAEAEGWPLAVEALSPLAWLSPGAPLPAGPLLTPLPVRWDGAHLTSAWFQVRDLQLYDTPPSVGAPKRRSDSPLDIERLERLFRSSVEGPECATLLAAVLDRLRRERETEESHG